MKRLAAILIMALAATQAFAAIELASGRIKVVLDERNGRFTLYYMSDVGKKQFVALLDDKEARTSFPTLYVDQRAYKLGESADFRVSAARNDQGLLVEYRSSSIVVKQYIDLASSPGSPLADGISIRFSIENISERDLSVGLRYLFDTWLGERESTHFLASKTGLLAGETLLQGSGNDEHVVSAGMGASVHFPFGAPATRPDKAIAANWKRLSDSSWSMDVNPARNFTLMPYSVNDSALALFYEPVTLRRGSTRSIDILVSASTPGSYGRNAGRATAPTVASESGP